MLVRVGDQSRELVRVGNQSRELVHVGDQSRVLAIMHLDACLLAIRKGVGDQKWCWRSDQRCWRLEARDLLAIESEMCWRWRSLPLARARCTQPHPIVLQPTPTRRRPPRTRRPPPLSGAAPQPCVAYLRTYPCGTFASLRPHALYYIIGNGVGDQ